MEPSHKPERKLVAEQMPDGIKPHAVTADYVLSEYDVSYLGNSFQTFRRDVVSSS